jgi:hypothetical protein
MRCAAASAANSKVRNLLARAGHSRIVRVLPRLLLPATATTAGALAVKPFAVRQVSKLQPGIKKDVLLRRWPAGMVTASWQLVSPRFGRSSLFRKRMQCLCSA